MTRTYHPVNKHETLCACGCGRLAVGRSDKRYYEANCRSKAQHKRKLAQKLVNSIQKQENINDFSSNIAENQPNTQNSPS